MFDSKKKTDKQEKNAKEKLWVFLSPRPSPSPPHSFSNLKTLKNTYVPQQKFYFFLSSVRPGPSFHWRYKHSQFHSQLSWELLTQWDVQDFRSLLSEDNKKIKSQVLIHDTLYTQGLKKTWIQACPLSKQLSHFFCPVPLLVRLS